MSRQCRTIFQIIFLFCINFELCKKRSRKSAFVVLHPSFAQLTNSWKMHLQWTATTFAKEIPAPATSAWLWWDTLSKPEPSQNEKSHYWLWWYVTCLLYSACYQTSNFYLLTMNLFHLKIFDHFHRIGMMTDLFAFHEFYNLVKIGTFYTNFGQIQVISKVLKLYYLWSKDEQKMNYSWTILKILFSTWPRYLTTQIHRNM